MKKLLYLIAALPSFSFASAIFSPGTGGGGGGGGTTIWVKEDGTAKDNAVSTINFQGGLNVTSSPAGQVNVSVDFSTFSAAAGYFIEPATVTIQSAKGEKASTMTITGLSPGVMFIANGSSNVYTSKISPSTDVASGVLPVNVVASSASAIMLVSSFPVVNPNVGSFTNSNVTADAYGRITAISNGSASGGGYFIEPATVTIQSAKGEKASTMTITSLSPGVMHIVAGSSDVATLPVSLSTETSGVYVASLTVTNALILSGTNNASNAAPILGVNASSVAVLTAGLVPNSEIDGSSITKQGLLVAGSNITLTPSGGQTTIDATGGGSSGLVSLSTGVTSVLPGTRLGLVYRTITTTTTLDSTDAGKVIICAATQAITVTLPDSLTMASTQTITIWISSSSSGLVTISTGVQADSIDGASTRAMWDSEWAELAPYQGLGWSKKAGKTIPMMAQITTSTGVYTGTGFKRLVISFSVNYDNTGGLMTSTATAITVIRGSKYLITCNMGMRGIANTTDFIMVISNGLSAGDGDRIYRNTTSSSGTIIISAAGTFIRDFSAGTVKSMSIDSTNLSTNQVLIESAVLSFTEVPSW